MSSAVLADKIIEVAREASEICQRYWCKPLKVWRKSDNSEVSEADLASHEYICDKLSGLFPKIPVVSEEDRHKIDIDADDNRPFFLVDPLDGTRNFLNGSDQYCVNIALIAGTRSIFGVIAAPSRKKLAHGGMLVRRSILEDESGRREISCSPRTDQGIVIIEGLTEKRRKVRKGHDSQPDILRFGRTVSEVVHLGSALKQIEVARGAVHSYSRSISIGAWDIAAGQAIINSAGGEMVAKDAAGVYRPCKYHSGMGENRWSTPPFHAAPLWLLASGLGYQSEKQEPDAPFDSSGFDPASVCFDDPEE